MDIEPQNEEIVQNDEITEEQVQKKNDKKQKTKKGPKSDAQNSFTLLTCPYSNYTPSKIESFCYDETSALLAIAREDCTIDIYHYPSWNVRHRYFCDQDSPIRRVKWITIDGNSKYLVVAHVNCLLSIYDLKSLKPIVTKNTNGNAIWDIAVHEDLISLACDDGGIIVYKYEGEDDLYVHKNLRQCQEKVLCVAYDFQNPKVLYAGYEKGYIRKHDIKQGTVTVTMNIDKNEMVWSLLSVNEENLIIGGSSGNIYVFEAKFGTLLSQLKTHEADITAIIINSTRDVVYATGLDSKIVSLEKITSKNMQEITQESWIVSSHDRGQSHDISALALLNDDVLISGGVTTDICIYNLERGRFKERKTSLLGNSQKDIKLRHITSLPWLSTVSVCDSRNLIGFAKTFSIELWNYDFVRMEYSFLVEIKTKTSPVICFDISSNSKFFGYSTLEETLIYKFDAKKLELQKIHTLEPSCTFHFNASNDGYYRIDMNSKLTIHELNSSSKSTVVNNFQSKYKGTFLECDFAYTASAVAFGSRVSNEIFVYETETKNLIKIPVLMENHNYTAFKILAKKILVIAYENNKFVEYDWGQKALTDWSIQNMQNFPHNYMNKYNRIVGILPNPVDSTKYILYTNYYLIKIRTNEPIPKVAQTIKPGKKTHKSNEEDGSNNFQIVYREKPIVKMQNLSDQTILCVEYSWKEFASNLPGAINAKKYGL